MSVSWGEMPARSSSFKLPDLSQSIAGHKTTSTMLSYRTTGLTIRYCAPDQQLKMLPWKFHGSSIDVQELWSKQLDWPS